jgi:hypothetical protein
MAPRASGLVKRQDPHHDRWVCIGLYWLNQWNTVSSCTCSTLFWETPDVPDICRFLGIVIYMLYDDQELAEQHQPLNRIPPLE